METSLKTGFAQVFSCCPKNLSCPNFGGAAAPLAPPARTPMVTPQPNKSHSIQTDVVFVACFPSNRPPQIRHCIKIPDTVLFFSNLIKTEPG